jgi:hypothetical protein
MNDAVAPGRKRYCRGRMACARPAGDARKYTECSLLRSRREADPDPRRETAAVGEGAGDNLTFEVIRQDL